MSEGQRERAKRALADAYEASWTQVQVLAQAYPGRKPIYLEPQDFAEGAVDAVLSAVFPVGEPDEQKTINGLLDAVERLNDQKDALRRENGQLRELLDLPIGERVEAVAELAEEPDDERLVEKVAELMRRQEGEHRSVQWNLPVYRKRARAVVAAVRAADREPE